MPWQIYLLEGLVGGVAIIFLILELLSRRYDNGRDQRSSDEKGRLDI